MITDEGEQPYGLIYALALLLVVGGLVVALALMWNLT